MKCTNQIAMLCILTGLAYSAHAHLPDGRETVAPAESEGSMTVVATVVDIAPIENAVLDESGWDGVVYPVNAEVADLDSNFSGLWGADPGEAQTVNPPPSRRAGRHGRHREAQSYGEGGYAASSSCGGSGMASWYGPGFAGHSTSSGERFNTGALTAAHKTLPFGTHVQVTNLKTRRSIVVRINDRGPFVRGRVIDLSPAAAHAIGMSGTTAVQLTCV